MVAETLLLLNPRKRRRSGKRRTAAQRAATKKLVEFMRAKRSRGVRKNPRRKSRSNSSINFTGATMKRRTSRRKYRRNPIGRGKSTSLSVSGALGVLKPAAAGAAGALALNGILRNVPLPATLMDGRMAYVTKAGIAILIGVVGTKLPVVRKYAHNMAIGALTVTLADIGKEIAAGAGVNLSGVGYVNPGWIATPVMPGGRPIPGAMGNARGMGRTGRAGQYLPSPAARNAAARVNMAQYVRR